MKKNQTDLQDENKDEKNVSLKLAQSYCLNKYR